MSNNNQTQNKVIPTTTQSFIVTSLTMSYRTTIMNQNLHDEVFKVYTCFFVGRLINSAGIFYPIKVDIECKQNEILTTLYKKYEHIKCLTVFAGDDDLQVVSDKDGDSIGGITQTWENSK